MDELTVDDIDEIVSQKYSYNHHVKTKIISQDKGMVKAQISYQNEAHPTSSFIVTIKNGKVE